MTLESELEATGENEDERTLKAAAPADLKLQPQTGRHVMSLQQGKR